MMLFTFDREDPSYCRVYYRSAGLSARAGKHLYCIQNDGGWGKDNFVFYSCTSDGEPSYPLRMPMETSFDRKVLPASVVK